MEINRDNYEAFLLDMIEGNLTAENEEKLIRFLNENPGLAADFDIKGFMLPSEENHFSFKDDLKKGGLAQNVTKNNYDQFCIARLEGDLPAAGTKKLELFLRENPEFYPGASLYDKLLLKADRSVVFPSRIKLKRNVVKPVPVRKLVFRIASIAASIVILLSAYLFVTGIRQEHFAPQITTIPPFTDADELISDIKIPEPALIPESIPDDLQVGPEINQETLLSKTSEVIVKEEPFSGKGLPYREREEPLVLSEQRLPGILVIESHGDPHVFTIAEITGYGKLPGTTEFADYENYNSDSRTAGIIALFSRSRKPDEEPDRLTFWDLASAGIKGINTVTGTDLLLEREYDHDGNLVHVAFSSGIIEFRRSTGNE